MSGNFTIIIINSLATRQNDFRKKIPKKMKKKSNNEVFLIKIIAKINCKVTIIKTVWLQIA